MVSSEPVDSVLDHPLGAIELYGVGLIFVGQYCHMFLTAFLQDSSDTLVVDDNVFSCKENLDGQTKTRDPLVDVSIESMAFKEESRGGVFQAQRISLDELIMLRGGGEHFSLDGNWYRLRWLYLGIQENFYFREQARIDQRSDAWGDQHNSADILRIRKRVPQRQLPSPGNTE